RHFAFSCSGRRLACIPRARGRRGRCQSFFGRRSAASNLSNQFQHQMGKHILILISALALGTSSAVAQGHEHEEAKQKYTCVMHPEVVMDHPGNCPKCGMKLVPLKEETPKPHAKIDNGSMPKMKHDEHEQEVHGEHKMEMSMRSSVDIADPMSREGSGT